MNIELNLWFSQRLGSIYGQLNINQKEYIENIQKLVPITEFCELTIKKRFTDEVTLVEFLESPECDHDALFAWTKEGSMISWNTKKDYVFIIYQNESYTLNQNKKMKNYPGAPDVCFRK